MALRNIFIGIFVVFSTAGLIVWQGMESSKPVQEIVEDTIESVVETASELAGQEIDVEVDIDPSKEPKCMRCRLHCPKEE